MHRTKKPYTKEQLVNFIEQGKLGQADPRRMDQENLTEEEWSRGDTVIELAVIRDQLRYIPVKYLTAGNVSIPDAIGGTVLHIAAQKGSLREFPSRALTKETISIPNEDGETPLTLAAKYGHIAQIPTRLLTARNLLATTSSGETRTLSRLIQRGDIPKLKVTHTLARDFIELHQAIEAIVTTLTATWRQTHFTPLRIWIEKLRKIHDKDKQTRSNLTIPKEELVTTSGLDLV